MPEALKFSPGNRGIFSYHLSENNIFASLFTLYNLAAIPPQSLCPRGVYAHRITISIVTVKWGAQKSALQVLPSPKMRSSRWVSSSIPEYKWETELGRTCSAEYQVNNAMSPVLFYEGLQNIQENAVIIEVRPKSMIAPLNNLTE